jgi:engulfment/cell motility protein 1
MEINVTELVERLGNEEDAVRKMAVFKLQSSIGDPSFADVFIAEGGLTRLRYLTLNASGNTLAYSLTSFARLLEVDKGWECVDQELVERVCSQQYNVPKTICAGVFYRLFTNARCRSFCLGR